MWDYNNELLICSAAHPKNFRLLRRMLCGRNFFHCVGMLSRHPPYNCLITAYLRPIYGSKPRYDRDVTATSTYCYTKIKKIWESFLLCRKSKWWRVSPLFPVNSETCFVVTTAWKSNDAFGIVISTMKNAAKVQLLFWKSKFFERFLLCKSEIYAIYYFFILKIIYLYISNVLNRHLGVTFSKTFVRLL